MSLASKYNGEIINADAIQMYRGLPIVTNKIPDHERNGIPHHLLDQIGLKGNPWTVNEFIEESSKIIRGIRARGKVPIVVGGTTYYVFSLIFKDSTVTWNDSDQSLEEDTPIQPSTKIDQSTTSDLSILNESTEVVLAKLRQLDPVMADSWHPKDRRKILRSLEICLKSGRKASEIYKEQNSLGLQTSSEAGKPTLRYEPLIFWIHADDAVLKSRLDARVDGMVQEGLLEEVREMRDFADGVKSKGMVLDKQKGIWVAIGYKELEPWLDSCYQNPSEKPARSSLKDAGIEAIKAGTRQYAKRQHRWIRIRLAQHLESANALERLFLLNGTDLDAWDNMVAAPSERITEEYLSGSTLPKNSSLSTMAAKMFESMQNQNKASDRQARFCQTCQKTLMTEEEWFGHVKSRRHKKVLEGMRKKVEQASKQGQTPQQRQNTVSV